MRSAIKLQKHLNIWHKSSTQSFASSKELHFNNNGQTLKRMQIGVEKLATVVGVTLGPKGRNVVLESSQGSPRIVDDGVTVAKEVEVSDPVENVGLKLVRQASSKTNDTAGDGTTTATILGAALISEGIKVVAAGSNPIQIINGIEKTIQKLVKIIKQNSIPIRSDEDLMNVATVSAGNNKQIGKLVSTAMIRVGKQGVVTIQESKTASDELIFVEGMQFGRGYMSPYFVTDPETMICEYESCRILLVDGKITSAGEMIVLLETVIREKFPLLIIAEDIEQEAISTIVVNKLRGGLKLVAIKSPGFGDRRTEYLEDIATMSGATIIKEELGTTLAKLDVTMLGRAAKIEIGKEYCTIVGDGSNKEKLEIRVKQIRNELEKTGEIYEREKLNERIARLSGGVGIINVGAQTETELKEKKLRVEDALCATKAAVEEGIVIGGACTLILLSKEAEIIKEEMEIEEQKTGAEIVKKALHYPLRLIANNSGANGSVVVQKVYNSTDAQTGYNAASGKYENLMESGIIDPAKVIRCALENAGSVARTFLTADCVVCETHKN